MINQMSLSASIVGFVESALNSRTVQPPPAPGALDSLPDNMASLIETNTTIYIDGSQDNLIERNVDIITGGQF